MAWEYLAALDVAFPFAMAAVSHQAPNASQHNQSNQTVCNNLAQWHFVISLESEQDATLAAVQRS